MSTDTLLQGPCDRDSGQFSHQRAHQTTTDISIAIVVGFLAAGVEGVVFFHFFSVFNRCREQPKTLVAAALVFAPVQFSFFCFSSYAENKE